MHTSLARLSRAALCAAALSGATPAFSQLLLTNAASWNGLDYVSPFGEPEIATIGQLFTPDAGHTFMNSFGFHLRSDAGSDVDFRGYVAEWDGAQLTGPLLFTSAVRTMPAASNGFQFFEFNTGSLALDAGARYVAFLSASDHFDTVDGTAGLGSPVLLDSYAGGDLVFALNGADFGALFLEPWFEIAGMDLAFRMQFSREGDSAGAVPEPAAAGAIAAMALLALAGMRRVRCVEK